VEETKDALSLAATVRESGLDPYLLGYIGDVRQSEQRDKLPGEVDKVLGAGLTRMQAVIPSDGQYAKQLGMLAGLDAWTTRLERLGRGVVMLAVVFALVVLGMCWGSWRWGYGLGYSRDVSRTIESRTMAVCKVLGRARHDLAAHRAQTDALHREITTFGC